MKHPLSLTLLAAAALCAASGAWAGAPMATEDADVLARGECEWETVAERVRVAGASARMVETGVGCHAFTGTQAALRVARGKADGESFSGLALAGKTALLPRDGDGFGLTLAWGFEALKLPGSRLKYDSTSLALVASQGLGGGLTAHANLGVARSRLDDETTRFWALGAEWALGEQLDLLAETYGAQRSKPALGIGLRWNPSQAWSFGLMASQSRDTPKVKGVLLSAKLAF